MRKLSRDFRLDKIVRKYGIEGRYEVNVYSVSETEMKSLLDGKLHDVLSFGLDRDTSYPDGVTRLGDIVVCPSYARELGESLQELVEHGCLHLCGIHHR